MRGPAAVTRARSALNASHMAVLVSARFSTGGAVPHAPGVVVGAVVGAVVGVVVGGGRGAVQVRRALEISSTMPLTSRFGAPRSRCRRRHGPGLER